MTLVKFAIFARFYSTSYPTNTEPMELFDAQHRSNILGHHQMFGSCFATVLCTTEYVL